ncbi:PREDICTED: uncharacterized protein LOC108550494 [Eufriesea mexicana]|uniref:uncharacterized protein LOC108550494 n=1 Tax=Eufriesea mexicana TaxID=516756 RepID=UPI00083C5C31|nr:PREDICTED: uncharacterized protein LOC108550494 [Eufriesea mexicana]
MTAAKVLDISLTTFADVSIKKSDLRMNQHLYAMQNIYFLVPKGVFGLPKHAAKSHLKLMMMIAFMMYCGGLGYRTIIPLSKGRILLPNNSTIRLLPCPSYFMFFNEQATPNYEIIFVMQILGGFFNYSTLCASAGTCTMLCLHGNNVKQKSITLNWYRFPMKKVRNLLLVILMSSQPVKVTAGKFLDLSLITFTDIMKISMGYLNVLREVT